MIALLSAVALASVPTNCRAWHDSAIDGVGSTRVIALVGASNIAGYNTVGGFGTTAETVPAGVTYMRNGTTYAPGATYPSPHGPEVGLLLQMAARGLTVSGTTVVNRSVGGSLLIDWFTGDLLLGTAAADFTGLGVTPGIVVVGDTAEYTIANTAAGYPDLMDVHRWPRFFTVANSYWGRPGYLLAVGLPDDYDTYPGTATIRTAAERRAGDWLEGHVAALTTLRTTTLGRQSDHHLTSAGMIAYGRAIADALIDAGVLQ